MRKLNAGGGWQAIKYSIAKAKQAGGFWKLFRAMRTKNACKTCALGMGGQRGGMVNERGSFPEVCKKSLQAMVADMQRPITADFWNRFTVDELREWTPRQLEHAGRLIQPIVYERGAKHFRTITWQDGFQRIERQLKAISPDASFWYFSGRSSNEAGFLLQLAARLYGTNNVNNCSYYCHQASGVGLSASLGTGTATVTLDDLEQADLSFIIGGNPASNHPRLMTSLMHQRRRGGKVIVINPVRELGMVKFRVPSDVRSMLFGTEVASHYVQPHIGGDLALLTGLAKSVVELQAINRDFLQFYCREPESYLQWLEALSWPEIEAKCGIARTQIRSLAEVYAQSHATIFGWTMGITHHVHGVENVEAIVNLALLRGMVGRPGTGLMPIRGHSNVQGIGSVGVTPKLKDSIFRGLQENFGIKLPTSSGLDTMACMESAHQGKLQVGICLGGNLYGSNPDAKFAREALAKLRLLVTLSTTLNTGHVQALAAETLILPVLARDEEPQPTTQESMFNYVRLSEGGVARLPGPRSEVQVIAEIGRRLVGDSQAVRWSEFEATSTIRDWIGQVVPGYDAIRSIDKTKAEFQIEGRTFHHPHFPTADGRAVLARYALPELAGQADGQLRLMTVRSEGQFNTVVYEEDDLYRGQERRDVVLLHPDDLERMGIQHDAPVVVSSSAGEIRGFLARQFPEIRPGNALMYYPEANELVPRNLDPRSKTPAFKSVVVTVKPLGCRQNVEHLVSNVHGPESPSSS